MGKIVAPSTEGFYLQIQVVEDGPRSYSGSVEALWMQVEQALGSPAPGEDRTKL